MDAHAVCRRHGLRHIQLRNNAVNQAWTAGDVVQQQVLNNLAMFVANSNALPYFSYPNQSATNVTDEAGASVSPSRATSFDTANPLVFLISGNINGSRSAAESFTLTPVTDPRKLELMRCAYQQAVATCCGGQASQTCPDCRTRFNSFYTGDPNGNIGQRTAGIVTSNCLGPECWFHVCSKKKLPKHCPRATIGHYGDLYVWVPPEGRDQLTKLCMMILDFSLNNPPSLRTKHVVYYLDELGFPTEQDNAVGSVSADVNVNEQNESILSRPHSDEAALSDQLSARWHEIDDGITQIRTELADPAAVPGPDGNVKPKLNSSQQDALVQRLKTLYAERDVVEAKQRYLERQIKISGLQQEYTTPSASPTVTPFGPAVLPGQLILNTLGPQIP